MVVAPTYKPSWKHWKPTGPSLGYCQILRRNGLIPDTRRVYIPDCQTQYCNGSSSNILYAHPPYISLAVRHSIKTVVTPTRSTELEVQQNRLGGYRAVRRSIGTAAALTYKPSWNYPCQTKHRNGCHTDIRCTFGWSVNSTWVDSSASTVYYSSVYYDSGGVNLLCTLYHCCS
jgi:hypothetical protein